MIGGLKTGLFIFTFDFMLNKNDCWNVQSETDCSLRLHTTLDNASSCRLGPQPSDTSAEQRQRVGVKMSGVLAGQAKLSGFVFQQVMTIKYWTFIREETLTCIGPSRSAYSTTCCSICGGVVAFDSANNRSTEMHNGPIIFSLKILQFVK